MGFDDLDDLNDLDEMPPFEEDLDLPGFDEPGTGGISRTFKILGGLLLLLVVIIVGGLIFWALGDEELTPNQQTSTAVILTNTALAEAYSFTQTAQQVAVVASQEYLMTAEFNATQTEVAFQEEQNRAATAAAETATVEFGASQTAAALHSEQTATAEVQQATQEAVNRVFGILQGDDSAPFSGVTLYLYRDNGDGVFTPADIVGEVEVEPGEVSPVAPGTDLEITPPPPAATAPSTEAQPVNYGDQVTGQVEMGVTSQWTFTGTTGDVISIFADADETSIEADMYLALIGPTGQSLITDDDGGEGTNSAIVDFTLPADGEYIIQVSTVSEPGGYFLQLVGPGGTVAPIDDYASEYVDEYADEYLGLTPTEETAGTGGGGMQLLLHSSKLEFLRQDITPTPGLSDELIQTIVTGELGDFDFGTLEPGIYWLVVEYETLPDEIKAQLPPEELIYIMVEVPLSGEVSFTIGVTPTPTPDFSAADATGTAIIALTQTAMPPITGTPATATPGTTTPTQLPQTGLFSGSSGDDFDGSSGLTVLAIAAMGLVAVVFIARKLRSSST